MLGNIILVIVGVEQHKIALDDEVEHLRHAREGPESGEEDVDKGALELPGLWGREWFHQLLEGARFEEPDADRLPLQVGDVVIVGLLGEKGLLLQDLW